MIVKRGNFHPEEEKGRFPSLSGKRGGKVEYLLLAIRSVEVNKKAQA